MIAFAISCVMLFLIVLSVIARANDIRKKKGLRIHLRLIGLILMTAAPFGIAGYEISFRDWPNWYDVLFRAGVLFVLMTTPGQPPWSRFLWKGSEA